MSFKEKIKSGEVVFGAVCNSGSICVIENLSQQGLDFIYLDLEHTIHGLNSDFEKQIMAAKFHDIAILVRVPDDGEVAIRKLLEWGADGIIIPHCKSGEMVKKCVEAAKFAPVGRRGGESNVRSANYGCGNFDWNEYIKKQNSETMIIPMDEDFEFTENIDDILAVKEIDAINFGPVDYANSLCLPISYGMGKEVKEAFDILVEKTKGKGIGILCPAIPPTQENVENAVKNGVNMVIIGSDVWHMQNSIVGAMKDVILPFKESQN